MSQAGHASVVSYPFARHLRWWQQEVLSSLSGCAAGMVHPVPLHADLWQLPQLRQDGVPAGKRIGQGTGLGRHRQLSVLLLRMRRSSTTPRYRKRRRRERTQHSSSHARASGCRGAPFQLCVEHRMLPVCLCVGRKQIELMLARAESHPAYQLQAKLFLFAYVFIRQKPFAPSPGLSTRSPASRPYG